MHRHRIALREPSEIGPPVVQKADAEILVTQETTAAEIVNSRVGVGVALVSVAERDKARRGLRFRNAGNTILYLGGSGVTSDTAVVKLESGDIWEETLAAAAAWWAVSSAAGGALALEAVR